MGRAISTDGFARRDGRRVGALSRHLFSAQLGGFIIGASASNPAVPMCKPSCKRFDIDQTGYLGTAVMMGWPPFSSAL